MKKLFTAAMLAALALGAATMTSCKKDDPKEPASTMTVKFNSHTYTIPATLDPDDCYYYDYHDNYQIYLEFDTPDGNRVDINIDLDKAKTGPTAYTLAETTEVYWYFFADLEDGDGNEIVDLYGHNDGMSGLSGGKIMMRHLGGGKFRLVANATAKSGDTFSIDFEGTLHREEESTR